MTEERNDGTKEGGAAQPPAEGADGKLAVADVVAWTIDAFQKVIPSWQMLVMLDLLRSAVEGLQHYVNTDNDGISWGNPFAQLEYEVELLEEEPPAESADRPTKEDAVALSWELLERIPDFIEGPLLQALTRDVMIRKEEPFTDNGRPCNCHVILPPDVDAEVKGLPESERDAKLTELAAGFEIPELEATGTANTPAGKQAFTFALVFAVRALTVDVKEERAFYPIQVGLDFTEGDPSAWAEEDRDAIFAHLLKAIDDMAAPYLKERKAEGKPRTPPTPPNRVSAVRPEDFAVAGGYVRPIFGLSERPQDLPLLRNFYATQTPLNWAVGLALFSLTDEDRVRSGDWQEVKVGHLTDRVFCLTERDAQLRGDHRTDILAEVVNLHTTRNWYYEVETVRFGRAWKKRAVIGSQYAIPELQLIFLDMKTGKRTFPTDAAVRELTVSLEVKGRRILKPDGKDIPSLPAVRWKLEAIRWRWVQAFNDDLLLTPALVENGKRKGLPKKTTRGKTIRKGYLIRVADNVFTALHRLRKEGPRSQYACRLLVMLAHNLNKTESGIAADRVFRMLGIPENYEANTHRKPEGLVADAVARLMSPDIGALRATSDTTPRTDPNHERRKGPYYRFIRSPDYTPRTGIASKEDALTIEAEYADAGEAVEEDAQPPALPGPKAYQAALPGMEAPPAQPIPSGPDIRAARQAAGLNLRRFSEAMAGPSFKTWSMIETGQRSASAGRIPEAVWQRVRDFIAQHAPKAGSEGKGKDP